MRRSGRLGTLCAAVVMATTSAWFPPAAHADGDLHNVRHIIVVMQENHSFDNYLGALAFVPNSPYHGVRGRGHGCAAKDTTCVDGLNCKSKKGTLVCRNANKSNLAGRVRAFHDTRYCPGPDLEHGWGGSHREGNFRKPNGMTKRSPNDGFVRVNAATQAPAQATDHDTMGYYTDADLPFYYGLAETFAISDRYFAAVIGPTFPNRSYLLAATSFGHLTTNEIIGPYRPITGTIFDVLDAAGVSWIDYYSDVPYASLMFGASSPHTRPVSAFAADAAAGTLPDVAFVDSSVLPTQTINGHVYETDEHPPQDIRAGQYFVSTIVSTLRNSPSWNDSVLLFTYDEHGGFYDHVAPPRADQGGVDTPDGIAPGQCADRSNPPSSLQPGGGKNCAQSSTVDAPDLCHGFSATGAYPTNCATFDQLGFRLPFIAVSPFAKSHYVSHVVQSHTSILALIEKRFGLSPLTARDAHAGDLEDLFDFDHAPSLNATIGTAQLPTVGDHGCPFGGSPSGAFVD